MSWFACSRSFLRQFSSSSRLRFPRDISVSPRSHNAQPGSVPSFRGQVARTNPLPCFADAVKHPGIGKHIIFVFGASALVYVVAAHNTNIETNFWATYLTSQRQWTMASAPTTGDMRYAQAQILLKKFQAQLATLTESLADAPIVAKSIILHSYARLAEMYLNASEGRRAGYGIAAVNVGIWVAWQIPVLRPFMMTHFTHHPLSGKTYTMLTSMFSHSSFIHVIFNCMALTSFASATSTWMTREQIHAPSHLRESTASYHFLALYLSSGLFSSLVSHLVTTRILYPRLVSKLVQPDKTGSPGMMHKISSTLSSAAMSSARPATDAATAAPTILPSLGASGAIYSTVVMSTFAFPDAQVALVFPPTPSFPIQYGLGGMVLLDCIGILRGWRFFDHYAHLGGAAFGALYYTYGMSVWDAIRVHTLKSDNAGRKAHQMFFYFSFLRTPPQSTLQSSSVVFTPQVTNDLRTEPFPTSIDIFYWWISSTAEKVTRLSEPAKLTTWRQENAYKPLQIPPPSKNLIGTAATTGIDCNLVLAPAPIVNSSVIDLRDVEIGRVPLPVCSLPIRISVAPQQQQRRDVVAASTKSPKQEAITRTFRLFDEGEMMQIKETVSFDLDKKLWDSGIGLSAWLVRLSIADVESSVVSRQQLAVVLEFKERLFGCGKCHIIELGAGTGIVSLVLAVLRSAASSVSHAESYILSTDLPSSMELMSQNIRTNAALFPNCPPTALPLNWDEELPETVQNVRERGGFDLIVMADVTYNTSSFPALLRTLASLLALSAAHRHGVADDAEGDADNGNLGSQEQERDERDHHECGHDGPLVLLAYKERDPAERQLWDMLTRETGVVLECVGNQVGAGGLPVEIWLGKIR